MNMQTSHGWSEGRDSVDQLFSVAYEELRRLAGTAHRRQPDSTLNPTALVNEAYMRLAGSRQLHPDSRLHFMRIAAKAMRQVLIEAARRRSAQKRGGEYAFVSFDEAQVGVSVRSDELLALDDALENLGRMHPRQATMVEYRFYGGLEVAEIAELLEVSESTVLRDWRAARAWLLHQLRHGQ